MLRLPPTTIIPGQADFDDFERRRRHGRTAQMRYDRYEQAPGSFHGCINNLDSTHGREIHPCTPECVKNGRCNGLDTYSSTHIVAELQETNAKLLEENSLQRALFCVSTTPADQRYDFHMVADEDDCTLESLDLASEAERYQSRSSSSPSLDDFYYGGFLEGTSKQATGNQQWRTPSATNGIQNSNNGLPLDSYGELRSQLFPQSTFSQVASSSSEHRPTTRLTPRVNSQVLTCGSPGIIFQYPPRRPGQRQYFRHQTNSFSFDSSERSNAAYEQNRVSSTSSGASVSQRAVRVNLQEELRGVSVTSSRSSSLGTTRSYLGESNIRDNLSPGSSSTALDATTPTLAQFAITQQVVSTDEHLPTEQERQLGTASARFEEDSPLNSPAVGTQGTSAPYTPLGVLRSAARLFISYRHRSPVRRQGSPDHPSPSPTLSTTPRQSRSSQSYRLPFRTSSRAYRVYNDQLPSHSQPQTPADVPEARHRSRFHPSNTAPVHRAAMRARGTFLGNDGAASTDFFSPRLPPSSTTPSRRQREGDRSPAGLLTEGFRGLYGGRENGDEERNWLQGVRFSNAEIRLWGHSRSEN